MGNTLKCDPGSAYIYHFPPDRVINAEYIKTPFCWWGIFFPIVNTFRLDFPWSSLRGGLFFCSVSNHLKRKIKKRYWKQKMKFPGHFQYDFDAK